MRLISDADWSGYRLGDLRAALRSLITLTLEIAGPVPDQTLDYWRGRCDPEIDFLVHSFALLDVRSAHDDPSKGVDELVRQWGTLPLSRTSKQNLLPVYLNTYFFKFIAAVELPKLQLASTSPGLTLEQCVDFYITHLLYNEFTAANPGLFVTYEQIIPRVDPGRVAALQRIRGDLVAALTRIDTARLPALISELKGPYGSVSPADAQALEPVFRSLFLLMTYYVGSDYRRVHDAVTTLLDVGMADVRNAFFESLPTIIQRRGALIPQISIEATLADLGQGGSSPSSSAGAPTNPVSMAARDRGTAQSGGAEGTKAGGCYIATAVYGSYDCPEVWVLRRFRDQALALSWPGREFIRFYYRVSPHAVRAMGRPGGRLLRAPLGALVRTLRSRGYSEAPYTDATLREFQPRLPR